MLFDIAARENLDGAFRSLRIPDPAAMDARRQMDRLEWETKSGSRPGGSIILLVGPPRSGKTKLARTWSRIDEDDERGGGASPGRRKRKPRATYVVARHAQSASALLHDICTGTGVVGPAVGWLPDVRRRAAPAIAQRSRLLIVDDFDDVCGGPEAAPRQVTERASGLVSVARSAGVGLVLVGKPRSLRVIAADMQLARRLLSVVTFRDFDITHGDGRRAFHFACESLQREVDRLLLFRTPVDLVSCGLSLLLHEATAGSRGGLLHLVRDACRMAVEDGDGSLGRDHILRATRGPVPFEDTGEDRVRDAAGEVASRGIPPRSLGWGPEGAR